MNSFNKLYNIILESIISLNKEYRKKLILNTTYSWGLKNAFLWFLDKLNNNKLADFLARYIADHQITEITDKRIAKISDIIKLNNSIDTQGFRGTILQFIDKYYPTILKNLQKLVSKTNLFLDKIPQFSLKKVYNNGVVIYRVLLSKAGMEAVRKIVDMQWGKDANPWCLIARSDGKLEHAWIMWTTYIDYPKHIAFQNGQLLSFCADADPENNFVTWWDRLDKPHDNLILLDGSLLETLIYKWSPELKAKIFAIQHHLTYNLLTKLFDCEKNVLVKDKDLVDGHLPVKFGIVKGTFRFSRCLTLTTLLGCPSRVEANFVCASCKNLKSLVDAPKYVGCEFDCHGCDGLTDLQGSPEYVGTGYDCHDCKNLKSLKGITQNNQSSYWLWGLPNLTSLVGLPNEVKKHLTLDEDTSLTSLEGCPKRIGRSLNFNGCTALTSLIGGPEYVGDEYSCQDCYLITSLKGAPRKIGSHFSCNNCINLLNLKYAPEEVGGNFSCMYCPKITTLKDLNCKIKFNLICRNNLNLDVTDLDRQKWNIQE